MVSLTFDGKQQIYFSWVQPEMKIYCALNSEFCVLFSVQDKSDQFHINFYVLKKECYCRLLLFSTAGQLSQFLLYCSYVIQSAFIP